MIRLSSAIIISIVAILTQTVFFAPTNAYATTVEVNTGDYLECQVPTDETASEPANVHFELTYKPVSLGIRYCLSTTIPASAGEPGSGTVSGELSELSSVLMTLSAWVEYYDENYNVQPCYISPLNTVLGRGERKASCVYNNLFPSAPHTLDLYVNNQVPELIAGITELSLGDTTDSTTATTSFPSIACFPAAQDPYDTCTTPSTTSAFTFMGGWPTSTQWWTFDVNVPEDTICEVWPGITPPPTLLF